MPEPLVIRIAILGPLTSTSNAFGIAHLQGATLAVEEYNRINFAKSRSVQLEIFDDRSDPQLASLKIKSIDSENFLAVLGPANSSVAKSLLNYSISNHTSVPIISSLATSSSISGNLLESSIGFRANVSDKKRIDALLNTLFSDVSVRPEKIAMIYEQADPFGQGMRDNAIDWIHKYQPTFLQQSILQIGYNRNISREDALEIAAAVQSAKFESKNDNILLLGIARDAITLTKALRDRNNKSTVSFNEPDETVFKAAAVNGIPIQGVRVLSVYYPDNTSVNSFKAEFRAQFDEVPSFSAALTYDAMRILLNDIDTLLDAGERIADVGVFRADLIKMLADGPEPNIDYVISGDHTFVNHEYRRLDFQKLKYNSQGDLVPWDALIEVPLPPRASSQSTPETPPLGGSTPPWTILFLVAFCGFLGSTLRSYNIETKSPAFSYKRVFLSLNSILIDPLVAILVSLVVVVFLFVVKGNTWPTNNLWTMWAGAIVIGFLAGFQGVKAIDMTLAKFGLKNSID